MGEKVKSNGKTIKIVRESGFLYFTKGDPINICRTKMQHKGRKKSKQSSALVLKTGVKRATGYLFYIDGPGFLCKAKMKRRGSKKK